MNYKYKLYESYIYCTMPAQVEIPTKYMNRTCGLCGDFNGVKDNDLIGNGASNPIKIMIIKQVKNVYLQL